MSAGAHLPAALAPRRQEIWKVRLDPTQGSETQKTRPCVVVSSAMLAFLPVRIIVPVTELQSKHASVVWRVPILPSGTNGLTKPSVADTAQVRCVSTRRFVGKLGRLEDDRFREILAALVICLDAS